MDSTIGPGVVVSFNQRSEASLEAIPRDELKILMAFNQGDVFKKAKPG